MRCIKVALPSLGLAIALAACSQGPRDSTGTGSGTGTEVSCEDLLQSVKDPPGPTETNPNRIIAFIRDNKEALDAMDPATASALWQCIKERRR